MSDQGKRRELSYPQEVPILATSRLKLRPHRLDDFVDCAALWADPLVTRYIGGRPFTEEEVWARLLRYVGHWTLMGFGYWAVEERSTGAFVGELGFAELRRDMDPSIQGMPELGWVLTPKAHGKGYATEAVTTVLSWGDAHFGKERTVCIIDPDNAASVRVAEKSGFRLLQHATYKGEPTLLFARG